MTRSFVRRPVAAVTSLVSVVGLLALAACSAAPEQTSDTQEEAFGIGGFCSAFPHPWTKPYINSPPNVCIAEQLNASKAGKFDNTGFDQALKAHGCHYNASDFVEFMADAQTHGFWNITLCPDDCTTRTIVDQYWNVAPFYARTDTSSPSSCFPPPPAGMIYVPFDPHCQGGCPDNGI